MALTNGVSAVSISDVTTTALSTDSAVIVTVIEANIFVLLMVFKLYIQEGFLFLRVFEGLSGAVLCFSCRPPGGCLLLCLV